MLADTKTYSADVDQRFHEQHHNEEVDHLSLFTEDVNIPYYRRSGEKKAKKELTTPDSKPDATTDEL